MAHIGLEWQWWEYLIGHFTTCDGISCYADGYFPQPYIVYPVVAIIFRNYIKDWFVKKLTKEGKPE